jgi:hypothetical protein
MAFPLAESTLHPISAAKYRNLTETCIRFDTEASGHSCTTYQMRPVSADDGWSR